MCRIRRRARPLAPLGALCLLSPLGGCRPAQRPNVVLISIDSLRADHLSCYGYAQPTSPAIDALAAAGVRFRTAISTTSWTLPAHAALLTGLPDSVHGAIDNHCRLAPERTTLAELFQRAGYRTVGYVSGPYLAPAFGFDQGFDDYGSCVSGLSDAEWNADSTSRSRIREWNAESHDDVTSPRVLKRAVEFLDGSGQAPFFLFLHWWDPHYDYEPPAPYDSMFCEPGYKGPITGRNVETDKSINKDLPLADKRQLVGLYDGEIAWTDHHIGLLLAELKRRGLWEKTIIVLTSDHGEEFFEHMGKTHQRTLFDEVIQVPLIARWPGGPVGRVVEGQVRLIDIFPTLVDLCGLPHPPEAAFGLSQSLIPFTHPGAAAPDLLAYSELHVSARRADLGSLRRETPTEAWKSLGIYEGDTGEWFYDLRSHPDERGASNGDPRAAEAILRLSKIRETLKSLGLEMQRGGVAAAEIPEAIRNRLKSLGYLKEQEE